MRISRTPAVAALSAALLTMQAAAFRITIDGEEQNVDFLEVTVNRPGAEHVLSWERIPYAS